MYANSNTKVKKVMNMETSFYQFLRLGEWKRIEARSRKSQQAFGMDCRLWITLELCFQFQLFLWKMQVWFLILGAAFLFFALGLQCVYMCECIRSEKSSPKPCIQWFSIFDFHDLFQSFLAMELAYFGRSCLLMWYTKSLGHDEWICCIKRFERWHLIFLSYLILIKWINNNNNSNN